MAAYSQDLRERVLDALQRGERPSEIAVRFVVSRAWVYQVRDRLLKDGKRTALQIGGYRRSRLQPLEQTLRCWLHEQADLTLAQMCERLTALGVQIKAAALWHQLDKWGLGFKKRFTPESKSERTLRKRVRNESTSKLTGIAANWCFSMRRGQQPA